MNGRKAKMLRKAAEYQAHSLVEYEPVQMHHWASVPTFEQHTRTVREMGPVSPGAPTTERNGVPRAGERRFVTSKQVTKTRYMADGKTPAKLCMNAKGEPDLAIWPVVKPVHIKAGTPRRVYQGLKVLDRKVGLDKLFHDLQEGV